MNIIGVRDFFCLRQAQRTVRTLSLSKGNHSPNFRFNRLSEPHHYKGYKKTTNTYDNEYTECISNP
ncbi:hypothetical protein BGP_3900 [Beggiatoa sp. PS]|nr:hypothetical protein BGP_3900 [Beggiatoa sp. PS]